MKKDMAKVLNERPRDRGCNRFPPDRLGLSEEKLDELPQRESMGQRWRHVRNDRNPNYDPLRRFLKSRVGQSWNDVWAEICEHNSPNNFIQYDLREQARDYLVETDVVMDGDCPLQGTHGYKISDGDFWVHPQTDILMQAPDSPRYRGCWQPRKEFAQIALDETHKYVQIKGVWYFVEFAAIPLRKDAEDKKVPAVFDMVLHQKVYRLPPDPKSLFPNQPQGYWLCSREWGGDIYAVSKRQIGKKELRKVRQRQERPIMRSAA